MKTTIYLIRHGQTEWNVERRMQGRADSPLTALGIEAAEHLAACFPNIGKQAEPAPACFPSIGNEERAPTQSVPNIGKIYSSPSGRTMQTANILFPDSEIICDNRLREINLGDWEGRLQADLDVEDPEQHSHFWKAPHLFKKEGAETFADVAERAVDFFKDISERHQGETVAVVSHTTVIRSILFSIRPRDLSRFWSPPAIYPTSLSEVEIVGGIPGIVRFGCMAHHGHDHSGAY